MDKTLDIYLLSEFVGHLIQDKGGQMLFQYAESWLGRPGGVPLRPSRWDMQVSLCRSMTASVPFYYPEISQIMAMKLGGEYSSEKVMPRNFEQFAEEAGLAKPMARRRMLEVIEAILPALPALELVDGTTRRYCVSSQYTAIRQSDGYEAKRRIIRRRYHEALRETVTTPNPNKHGSCITSSWLTRGLRPTFISGTSISFATATVHSRTRRR